MEKGFNIHILNNLLWHTVVMGTSSELSQPFRQNKKGGVWVGRRAGYIATTFALKEYYHPV